MSEGYAILSLDEVKTAPHELGFGSVRDRDEQHPLGRVRDATGSRFRGSPSDLRRARRLVHGSPTARP